MDIEVDLVRKLVWLVRLCTQDDVLGVFPGVLARYVAAEIQARVGE